MGALKRWWWIGAIVVVAGLAAYLVLGRGATAPGTDSGPGTAGTTASGTVTPGVTTTGTGAPGAGVTPGPDGTPATEIVEPKLVAKGSMLPTITSPPSQTVAQVKYTASRDGRLYSTRFRVYGTGPTRGGHGTVVALLDTWKAQKDYSDPLDMRGKNILLELGPGVSLAKGGSYNGTVKLVKRDDIIVFVITKAKLR